MFLIPFVFSGPFAWHGLLTFYVLLGLFGIWLAVMSWVIIRANRSITRAAVNPHAALGMAR